MKKIFITLMGMCLAFGACTNDEDETPKKEEGTKTENTDDMPEYKWQPAKAIQLDAASKAVNEGMKAFAWKLFGQVMNGEKGKDVLVSPYSLEADLSVLLCGLQGETRQELLGVMGLTNASETDINRYITTMDKGIAEADNMTRFTSAYSLWYNQSARLNPTFGEKIENGYGVEVYPVRFGKEATDKINAWCAEKTGDRIQHFLEKTEPDELMHLLNAVYFRSNWADHFDNVEARPFAAADGGQQTVETMWETFNGTASYAQKEGYVMAGVPFNNGAFEMFFVLPDENKTLSQVAAQIVKQAPDVAGMETAATLRLYVPKFESEYSMDLDGALKALGCQKMFSEGKDFQLFENVEMPVSQVLQKTFLKIDEKGAEAAAVTDIKMLTANPDASQPELITVDLNRPFIYGIVEKSTGLPLFIGSKGKI